LVDSHFEGTEMGRRKSGLSDLLDLAGRLPWKVSAALVPATFLILLVIEVASAQGEAVTELKQMSTAVIRGSIHTFAYILKFIVPLAFAIGAVVSYSKRARSAAVFDLVRNNPMIEVTALTWQDFERLVGEGFRYRGFEVTERSGAGPDGGVDLTLARGHDRFLVQCKRWRSQSVGVSVIRELYGVMAAERVANGYVVTSGTFTREAKEFASGRNIELIDGRGLEGLIRDGRKAAPASPIQMPDPAFKPSEPICPACKATMVLRTAKRGNRVGSSFWGCAQYPKCRQTVTIGS
jgi:restriction system protein